MTTQNIFDLSDLWNDGATTFSAIKMNVTDTASASGSLLMDLQVGGVSRFSVDKNGFLTIPGGSTSGFDVASTVRVTGGTGSVRVYSAGSFSFSSTGQPSGAADIELRRDAADTLAQRRSTNPQAFRISNTHTDASNYERGKIAWESNVLRIGTEKAGTGSARALELQTDGVTRVTIGAATGAATFTNSVAALDAYITRYISFGSGFSATLTSSASGVVQFSSSIGTGNGFDRLQFGGSTSSFPALKRSTTSLQARLADDSAFTNVQGKLTTETAYTAGAPTATGYLVLYDSAGTAYKVPAEAL